MLYPFPLPNATCLVPNYSEGKTMNRAAIIFGIVAISRPELLDDAVRKAVADSLIYQLGTENRNIFRTAVIEILGSAFPVWEPYVMAMSLFKALFQWIAKVTPCPENNLVPEPSLLVTIATAEQTLIKMIAHNSPAIIPLWLAELSATKILTEKLCFVAILSEVIRLSPECLKGYIPAICDVAVRFIDPSAQQTRTRLLPNVTALIYEIGKAYSFVRLHKQQQRLLVGGMDGVIVMFDLRTGTRSHIFEGHTKPVTSLAFSPDCKHICSYSFEEVTIRVWNVPAGFMSILNMVCKPIKTLIVDPILTETMASKHLHNHLPAPAILWREDHRIDIMIHDKLLLQMEIL